MTSRRFSSGMTNSTMTVALRELLERVKENPNGVGDADLFLHGRALQEVEALEKLEAERNDLDAEADAHHDRAAVLEQELAEAVARVEQAERERDEARTALAEAANRHNEVLGATLADLELAKADGAARQEALYLVCRDSPSADDRLRAVRIYNSEHPGAALLERLRALERVSLF